MRFLSKRAEAERGGQWALVLRGRSNTAKLTWGGDNENAVLEGKGESLKGREWLAMPRLKMTGVDTEEAARFGSLDNRKLHSLPAAGNKCKWRRRQGLKGQRTLGMSSVRGSEKMGSQGHQAEGPHNCFPVQLCLSS